MEYELRVIRAACRGSAARGRGPHLATRGTSQSRNQSTSLRAKAVRAMERIHVRFCSKERGPQHHIVDEIHVVIRRLVERTPLITAVDDSFVCVMYSEGQDARSEILGAEADASSNWRDKGCRGSGRAAGRRPWSSPTVWEQPSKHVNRNCRGSGRAAGRWPWVSPAVTDQHRMAGLQNSPRRELDLRLPHSHRHNLQPEPLSTSSPPFKSQKHTHHHDVIARRIHRNFSFATAPLSSISAPLTASAVYVTLVLTLSRHRVGPPGRRL